MGRVWSGVAVAALMVVGACTGAQGVAAADSGACETQSTTTIATDLSANGPLSSAVGCDSAQPVSGQAASSGGATSEPSGTIDTVAGGGIGDGGSALDAVFFLPSYETFDSSGNLYVSTHARVIKVTPSGIATTFAGTGTIGFQGAGGHHIYYGDGGPATAATFGDSGPSGLAFDSKGDLYIADSGDGVVRKVDTNGIITTVAGGGPISHYGIEGDNPRNVYLWAPDGVALDTAGDLFIADSGNCTVREVKASDGKIYTIAGIPPEQSNPTSYFTCRYTADGVPALGSALNQPKDVKVDAKGDVYIADIGNSRIREVDTLGIIHTVAGNGKPTDSGDGGPATGAGVAYPWHIAFDSSGDLYIVEYFNHKVRKVDPNGIITTFAGNGTDGFSGDGGPATQAQLLFPLGAAVDGAGNVYIADFGNNRVRRVDASTGTITTIAGNGDPPHIGNSYFGNGYAGDGLRARSASLNGPYGVAVDGSGDIYVADTSNSRVREVDATTGIIHTVARVLYPMGLAVDRRGNLYIAGGVVRKLDSRGVLTTVAGGGNPADGLGDGGPATGAALYATAVALDGLGNMYIADAGNQRIRLVDRKGIITTVAGSGTRGFGGDGGPATAAKLNGPRAVAVDSAGNLYIADAGNNRIRKVDTNGVITTVAGYWIGGQTGDGTTATGTALDFPTGVAVDSAGDLFISDTQNCLVREVDLGTGLTHIVAGVPLAYKTTSPGYLNCDFNGDGGPGNQAHVFGPTGMTLDANGNLFFADSFNNRIREVRGAG